MEHETYYFIISLFQSNFTKNVIKIIPTIIVMKIMQKTKTGPIQNTSTLKLHYVLRFVKLEQKLMPE